MTNVFPLPLMDGGEARGGAMEDRTELLVSFDAKRREKIDGDLTEAGLTGEDVTTGAGEIATGLEPCGFALALGKLRVELLDVVGLFRLRAK